MSATDKTLHPGSSAQAGYGADAPAVAHQNASEVRPPHESDPSPFDFVALSYDERLVRRRMLTLQGGERVLLDLPRATALDGGTRILLSDGRHVEVRAREEDVCEITAPDGNLARLAWHIGNRHTPCEIDGDTLYIQRDKVLADMIRQLGGGVRDVERPFNPEGGAYGHGHTHGHSHSHDPHEDPNAHVAGHDHDHHHHHHHHAHD